MKTNTTPSVILRRVSQRRGMTLLEITVVVVVLMLLTGMLWFAATSWKNGTDRPICVMNIRHMQVAVRSYANTSPYQPGTDVSAQSPPINLLSELVGTGKYVARFPDCPSNGVYQFSGANVIPQVGEIFMTCSLANSRAHEPKSYETW